jgi:putative tryptophan/tyrosine transport system substrate-binding protein
MLRREFFAILGIAAATPVFGASAEPRQRRIAVFLSVSKADPEGQHVLKALTQGLDALGWRAGANLIVDVGYGDSNLDRIRDVANQLIAGQPDVLVASSTPCTAAALEATHTIPVVFTSVADPIGAGFVQSLAKPGGNATGLVNLEASMGGKWLQLLTEVAPQVKQITMLFNPKTAPGEYYQRAFEKAAKEMGIEAKTVRVNDMNNIADEIAAIREVGGGLVVVPDTYTLAVRNQLVPLVNKEGVPAVYAFTPFVDDGGLISYGVDLADLHRRAAGYADAIFKGAKPAELPVQLPTKFELAVNLNTAKALGLRIPESLIGIADKVVE